jgi:hypothetical protein
MTFKSRDLSRRALLVAAIVLPTACSHTPPPAAATALPPIVFVHGNGDTAALVSTIWRFESNGWHATGCTAIDLPYPWRVTTTRSSTRAVRRPPSTCSSWPRKSRRSCATPGHPGGAGRQFARWATPSALRCQRRWGGQGVARRAGRDAQPRRVGRRERPAAQRIQRSQPVPHRVEQPRCGRCRDHAQGRAG